jgi:hypothetical protein
MIVIPTSLLILSLLSLFVGVIWLLMAGDPVDKRNDPSSIDESSPDIHQKREVDLDADEPVGARKDVGLESKKSISFAEIKNEMRAGQWQSAGPLLLAVGGFLGVLITGSLLILLAADNKLIGAIITIVAFITVARVVAAMIRA